MAERLPIYQAESEILSGIRSHRRLVVSAPTGSGKSTQVPQMLLDRGDVGSGQVVILQPRRLATRLLAARVASERGVKLGTEVGYQIRFENVTSRETRIRFVTEGVLLRQIFKDPALEGVAAVIFDEFHERHLYGDITLSRALDVQGSRRRDLQIAVMSATLDAAALESYMQPCRVVESHGRTYPVEIQFARTPGYLDKRPVWEQAAGAFADFVNSGEGGDVLMFMPGGFEIQQTLATMRRLPESGGFVLLPLHGELSPPEQDAAVARYDRRKVVVATNVAETSLTIEGVRCVIDSGLARIPRYDPYRGINTLLIEKISQASALQRAGRAGRTAPGLCLRLWSEEEQRHRPLQELPEIKRLDLCEVVLTLKAAGIDDLRGFRWLERPEEAALAHAEELLRDLGALEPAETPPGAAGGPRLRITPVGRKMLAFPLHPRYARMLLAAQEHGCIYEACLVAALTQGRDLLLRSADARAARAREDLPGAEATSDFRVLLRAWEQAAKENFRAEACQRLGLNAAAARQVGPLAQQFLDIARREGLDTARRDTNEDALRKCILLGFNDRVARRVGDTPRCELVHKRRGTLARESVVQGSNLLVAAEVREVEGKDKSVNTLLSLVTAIEERWLEDLFPGDINAAVRVDFDAKARRVYAEEDVRFRDLVFATRAMEPPPTEEAARLLAEEVKSGRLALNDWDESVETWILRLNLLAGWCPELELPPVGESERSVVIEQICHGALSYKDVKDKRVKGLVKSWLSAAQQGLVEKHAPERLALSNGRTPQVIYEKANPPHIAVRIQELFDVKTTPKIALGRVPVLVHVLAPSMRPVQITQDLPGFWRDHYPRIKQELQRRYPKHQWR